MITGVEKITFSAAATGTVVANVDINDCDSFSVAIAESAMGGTHTNHGYDVYAYDGSDDFTAVDSFGTADMGGAAAKAIVTRYGTYGAAKTTLLPVVHRLPAATPKIKVSVWITGAGGTATGTVFIFKHRI